MKKKLMALAAASMLLVPAIAGAEGFGIVEWSAEGTAMGGARMFADNDPAMIAYNPAHLVTMENKAAAVHATYISPHGEFSAHDLTGMSKDVKDVQNRISPGIVPGLYYAKKIDDKSAWGIGTFTRFGMICEFEKSHIFARSAYKSKMNGFSITPTYARKITKKFNAAIGAEANYVDLTLLNNPTAATPLGDGTVKISGDTWALGWNAAMEYKFDDKNEIGFVYRSKISQNMSNAKIKTDFITMHPSYGPIPVKGTWNVHTTKVVLPDTYTIGYGHKFDDKNRVEVQAMRCNWHTYDSLFIETDSPLGTVGGRKDWEDGWRYAVGYEHKFSPKYTGYLGFSYDGSCIPDATTDFMIPTGYRRTYTIGASYEDKKQRLTGVLGYMDIGSKHMGATEECAAPFESYSHSNYGKIISVGYTRFF